MRRIFPVLALFAVVSFWFPNLSGNPKFSEGGNIQGSPTESLKERLEEIDLELTKLPPFTMRNGVGRIGYHSPTTNSPNQKEWVEIDLGEERIIDQIVLVPVIWRDTTKGLVADGFPIRFQIRIGKSDDKIGKVVASFTEDDCLLPRIAPLVAKFEASQASWVRIEVSELSSLVWDKTWHRLKLSEVLVFSGDENIAINQPVKVSHPIDVYPLTIAPENLVDGFTPYEMDAATGDRSLAFICYPAADEVKPFITIDLGKSVPINLVHLHRVDMNDSVPQAVLFDYGIPERLTIEGAQNSDFSDAVLLNQYVKTSIYEVGPIIKKRFPETLCRYVRLTAESPFIKVENGSVSRHFGFSEIELLSNGKNVAKNCSAESSSMVKKNERGVSSLTDGRNFYGDILSAKEWYSQLALRHDLEIERPKVVEELNIRYGRQKMLLDRFRWVAVLLGGGIMITILFNRIIRLRQVAQMKQRLAADLHDELGANLHTIGLLSDLADDSNSPEELSQIHRRIRNETERSGAAVRRCTNMLEAKGVYTSLEEDIPRAARRILGNLKHDISIQGDRYLKELDPQVGYDLFLFYKECLVNISRHSDATEFNTTLIGGEKYIRLTVRDNGVGMGGEDEIPASLTRRASLLKANLKMDSSEKEGTSIQLKLPNRKSRKIL